MKVPNPKKLPSGNWMIQLRLGGKSKTITTTTKRECIEKATMIKAEHVTGRRRVIASDLTLKEATEAYIDKNSGKWSPATRQGYEKILRNNFPELFKLRIRDIDTQCLDDAVAAECKRKNARGVNYSAKSVRSAYGLVAEVLKANKIDFDTPRLPEVKKKPVQILLPEQVYAAVKGTEIELPCLLAMWMSFTMSEIRGLTKSKSIRNGQLSIVEVVVDVGGKPVRKSAAKEVERARTHNIPPYIQQLIDKVETDELVTLSGQAIYKRFQRLLEKNGLPSMSFHKLRHISASVGASLKVPDPVIQARGGWSSDYVMKRVYTHVFDEDRLKADDAYNAYFMGIINQNANENANT